MIRSFVAALTLATSLSAHAACSAQSGAERPHLIELYTSEGCSSCPPAEKWLSKLLAKPDVVGLEFHVDYWDDGGWRDPFDNKAYTQRQEKISLRAKAQTYTPQIWLDGELWRNWPGGDPPSAGGASPSLTLDVTPGETVRAHVVAGDIGAQHVYVVLTENGLSTSVRGGENKGRQLAHDQVVRAFAGPFATNDVSAELNPPRGVNLARSGVVAFVQDESSGHVSQVVRVALDGCSQATP